MAVREVLLVVLVTAVCGVQAVRWGPMSNPWCLNERPFDDVIPRRYHYPASLALRHDPTYHAMVTTEHMFPQLWSSSLLHDLYMFAEFHPLYSCHMEDVPFHHHQQEQHNPFQQDCPNYQQAVPENEDQRTKRQAPSGANQRQQQQDQEEEMEELIQKEACGQFEKAAKTSQQLHAVLAETENKRKVEEDGKRAEHLRREEEKRRLYKIHQEKLAAERREWERTKEQREKQLREREAQLKRDVSQQRKQQRQPNRQQYKKQASPQRQQNSRQPMARQETHRAPTTEVVSLQVIGYYPEDLAIRTNSRQLIISGKQTCDCDELCLEKEFERKFALPTGLDTRSLQASLNSDGQLTVTGQIQYRGVVQHPTDVRVKVKGQGLGSRPQVEDPTCGGRKTGFRLRKVAHRRPNTVTDVPEDTPQVEEYQDMEDNDEVTIEVVEE